MRALKRKKVFDVGALDTEGSWAISYGDMVTLLLAFFILFFAIDNEKARAKKLQQAVMEGLSPLEKVGTGEEEQGKLNIGKETGENIDKQIVDQWGARVIEVGDRIMVEFPNASFFHTAQLPVTKLGKKLLRKFANHYLPFAGTYRLNIVASADKRPVKYRPGMRFKDNLELSALRSISALRVLQKAGLPLTSMRVAGHGVMKLVEEKLKETQKPEELAKRLALARTVFLVIEPKTKD